METFTELKAFEENPDFQVQRQMALGGLTDEMVDRPILPVIRRLNRLPYCFTLQCCYGHFDRDGEKDAHTLAPLPATVPSGKVLYRIAYIAFCLEESLQGREFLSALKKLPAVGPGNVQLCCAEWFWDRQVNSFALQVEPDRFKHKDKVMLDFEEALHVEKVRNRFFIKITELLKKTTFGLPPETGE